ncbi:MAG TPA: hypothetical protein VG126_10060 [Thermoleophilaceae bacterium]|nr:hypothetical protein [Thermoleophilaceae bacterium]
MPSQTPTEQDRRETERYEPMPGVGELPAWLWRRVGRGGRLAALGALIVIVATAGVLVPATLESKEESAERDRRARAEQRAELVRRLETEQRPRFRRSAFVAPAGATADERLNARAALMEELNAEILADARGRARRGELDGPIRRVECEPFPRTVAGVGAHEVLSRDRGRYACVAVTAEFGSREVGATGVIGHQYRTEVDFTSGRYAFCKVSGQAGPSREQLVTTPKACGG